MFNNFNLSPPHRRRMPFQFVRTAYCLFPCFTPPPPTSQTSFPGPQITEFFCQSHDMYCMLRVRAPDLQPYPCSMPITDAPSHPTNCHIHLIIDTGGHEWTWTTGMLSHHSLDDDLSARGWTHGADSHHFPVKTTGQQRMNGEQRVDSLTGTFHSWPISYPPKLLNPYTPEHVLSGASYFI